MKLKISLTVRDVFNFLAMPVNYERIANRAETNFNKKHPTIKEISYDYEILSKHITYDESEINTLDYFDLIVWDNNSTDEELLKFFDDDIWNDNIEYRYILEFKILFIQSLKFELNNYIDNANRLFNILPSKA